jgi:hypothetical protein
MHVLLLLSSSNPCTGLVFFSQLREHYVIPWFSHTPPNEVLNEGSDEATNCVSQRTTRPLAVIRGQ